MSHFYYEEKELMPDSKNIFRERDKHVGNLSIEPITFTTFTITF